MKVPTHPTLIRRMRDARIRQLVARGPILSATLTKTAKPCGRPGCRCQKGFLHSKHYLTFKVAGKTQTVYVPLALVPEVRVWIKEHKRLKTLSQEASQLALALVRTHVQESKRKAGRW